MDKLRKLTYSVIIILSSFFCVTLSEYAQAEETGAFTYEVVFPENQHSDQGYFDLRMTPSQKQTVQIKLINMSKDAPVTIDVKRNTVKTNSNGVLEYGPNTIKLDKSAAIDFDSLVSVPESVTLAAGETKNLDIEIQMPEQSFDGVVAGGIQLEKKDTDEDKKKQNKETGVVNKYAFLVGVLLTETDANVEPEITFNSIYPDLSNYRNAIFVNFSNTQRTFIGDLSVEFEVRKKGSSTVLYDTKKTDMKMAPTSMMNFPLLLNGNEMQPGDYTGHVVVTSGDKRWEWEEDFEITKEQAEKFNKQDVSLVQDKGLNWKMILLIVGGVLILVIVILVIIYLYKNRKNKNKKIVKNKKKAAGNKKKSTKK